MTPLADLGLFSSFLLIFVSAAFTDNILMARFLGMCSCLGVSKRVDTSLGLGVAVVFVTTVTAVLVGGRQGLFPLEEVGDVQLAELHRDGRADAAMDQAPALGLPPLNLGGEPPAAAPAAPATNPARPIWSSPAPRSAMTSPDHPRRNG